MNCMHTACTATRTFGCVERRRDSYYRGHVTKQIVSRKLPVATVGQLASQGVSFRTLHVERSDLGTVFLNLTGRSLRD